MPADALDRRARAVRRVADAAARGVRRPRRVRLGAGAHLRGWTCVGYAADLREPGAQRAVAGRHGRRAADPRRGRRRARVREHLPAPRSRTAAVRRGREAAQHRVPVPLAGPTSSTGRCATRRASATSTRSTPTQFGLVPLRGRRLARLDLRRRRAGTAGEFADHVAGTEDDRRAVPSGGARRRRPAHATSSPATGR